MRIIRNAIRCNICGSKIESMHRHDYVQCKCGACAIDGGQEYLRRSYTGKNTYTELSIVDCDIKAGCKHEK